MEYFAGLFDAEGYVSLCKDGHFSIGTQMANEEIPNLFKENFGGKIYSSKRIGRKKTWSWVIATNSDCCMNFIDILSPFSLIKQPQLLVIRDYLKQSRDIRRQFRAQTSQKLSCLKQPLPTLKENIDVPSDKFPEESFWKWLAGFFDGDGNFCVYEYQGKPSIIFDSWIGIFNIMPIAIQFVKQRINGSISTYRGAKFPIWKWVCCQKDSEFVCNSLHPYLIIKKDHARLVLDFLNIKKTKIREQSYSFDQINCIRDIIKQIKHLNSL